MPADLAKQNEKIVMQVSFRSMLVNVGLAVGKVLAGLVARSGAMVSDGIHSASDVFSTVVVVIGYRLAGKESDERHPYGHERIECVAAILLAMILCITGFAIGLTGLKKIIGAEGTVLEVPGVLALVAAVVSIIVKEGMYWYTRRAAKKVNSGALMADAWHHRSDALSSVGSMVGILGALLGYPICDPIASVVICVFIVKAAYDIFKDAVDKMMDTACDEKIIAHMRQVILSQEGVAGIDRLQTRLFGARIYVDVEIAADGELPLREAHFIAERVHDAIERNFTEVKHCMVHVNPR
ncbi:MAG: cation transporter [Anaerotignum sp.]|nr:cation transporter [Anaerotignum sp.]